MRRIAVNEQSIRQGAVKLLEPRRNEQEMADWMRWVGYVRMVPCVEFQPARVTKGGAQ